MRTTKNLNDKLVAAHGRHVKLHGTAFRIMAHRLGTFVLAQAEEIVTGTTLNLITGRSPLVMEIRELISVGLTHA